MLFLFNKVFNNIRAIVTPMVLPPSVSSHIDADAAATGGSEDGLF
jgi:hypothetical protein